MCFNEDWRYQFTLANNFCLLELIFFFFFFQKAEKYPIRWSLWTGFTVFVRSYQLHIKFISANHIECFNRQFWHLTHWGRVIHICVSKLTILGSDNGLLSPGRRQAIIWTNDGILLIKPLGTNFNEMLIEILTFSLLKMRLKVSSAKWRPFCLGLNVLKVM